MGCAPFARRRRFPPDPVLVCFGRFHARRIHQSLRRAKKSSSFFAKKEAALPLIYARRRRKKVFGKPGFFRPPGTPAAVFPLSDFALVKSGRAHFPALLWESHRAAHFRTLLWKSPPGHRTFGLCSGEVRRAALLRFAVKKSRAGTVHRFALAKSPGGSVCPPSGLGVPPGGGQIPVCAWRRPRPPHA